LLQKNGAALADKAVRFGAVVSGPVNQIQ
jgi:hypothetical protein